MFSQSEEFSDLWQAAAPLKITSIPGGLWTRGTLQQKHLKYSLVLALPCSFLLCIVSYSLWSPSTESYYIFKGLQSLRKSNWFVALNLLVELLRKKLFNLIFYLYLEPLAWIQPAPYTHKLCECVQLSITWAYLVGIASRTLCKVRDFSTLQNGCFTHYMASLVFIFTS